MSLFHEPSIVPSITFKHPIRNSINHVDYLHAKEKEYESRIHDESLPSLQSLYDDTQELKLLLEQQNKILNGYECLPPNLTLAKNELTKL